ncbi:MAG: CvpA family protein [Ignavibacteria bacterium]
MNTLDIIIAILVLIPALLGIKNGFLKSIFSLAGIVAGLFLATRYNDDIVSLLGFINANPKVLSLISFIAIIVLTYAIFNYIANKISKFNFVTNTIDKVLGGALGLLKGLIFASLLLILTTNTFSFFSKEIIADSKFYSSVVKIAPDVYNYIVKFFPDAKTFYENLTI